MTYDRVRLDSNWYYQYPTLTEALEEIDPSSQYDRTTLHGFNAYQRQLYRFDIRVSGKNTSKVLDFFKTPQTAILFPEFVLQSVYEGMASDNRLLDVVGCIKHVYTTGDVCRMQSCISRKHGMAMQFPYEQIKFFSLPQFQGILKQIGRKISRHELHDAVMLAIDGDGLESIAAPVLDYHGKTYERSDSLFLYIANLMAEFKNHRLSTVIMTPGTLESTIPASSFLYYNHSVGSPKTVMGATIVECDTMPDSCILAIDKSAAIGMYRGFLYTDYERLINGQVSGTPIAVKSGFYKIDNNAAKVLKF